MKKTIQIVLGTVLIIAMHSCGSAKKIISGVISPKDSTGLSSSSKDKVFHDSIVSLLNTNAIDFQTFSGKIKVESSDNTGKNPDITVLVKMKKDSAIWLSLTATFLNVEVYRVYITPDSVILLDKREKTVQYRRIDYLKTVTQVPFDFKTLQDLLLGNAIFFNATKATYNVKDNVVYANYTGAEYKHLLSLTTPSLLNLQSKLEDVDPLRHRSANVVYKNYSVQDGKMFSNTRSITVSEKNRIDLNMDFSRAEFNKPLDINFSVPKGYKKK